MTASVRVRVASAALSPHQYAVVGEVVEAGEAATEWQGRRVIVPTLTSCGECDFCRRGATHGCADAAVLERARGDAPPSELETGARYLAAVDGDLAVEGPAAAVLGSEGLRAYAAYCNVGVSPGEPVVVVGEGSRSILVRQIATAKSAALASLETAPTTKPWRAFALDATAEDAARLAAALPSGSSLAVCPRTNEPIELDPASLAARGVQIHFVSPGHADLLPELVALAARRELELDKAVEIAATDDAVAEINDRGLVAVR